MIPGVLMSQQRRRLAGGEFTPSVVLDFVNEEYTVDGAAVALEDLVGDGAWFGPFDEGQVAGGLGLVSPAEGYFTGTALARILDGATIKAELDVSLSGGTGQRLELWKMDDADFFNGHFVQVLTSSSQLGDFAVTETIDDIAEDTTFIIAATFEADNIAASVDNVAAVSVSNPETNPTQDAAAFVLGGTSGVVKLKRLTIMSAVSNAELPTV